MSALQKPLVTRISSPDLPLPSTPSLEPSVAVDLAQVIRIANDWAALPALPRAKRQAVENLAHLAHGLSQRQRVNTEDMANLCSMGCRLCQHIRGGYCSHHDRGSADCVLGFHPGPAAIAKPSTPHHH